jgi:hypothetical protein
MHTPHVHCPISVKFGIRDLHIFAVERFVNVMKIGVMKGHSFVVSVRAVTFACVTVTPCGVLKVKNGSVKAVRCLHETHKLYGHIAECSVCSSGRYI